MEIIKDSFLKKLKNILYILLTGKSPSKLKYIAISKRKAKSFEETVAYHEAGHAIVAKKSKSVSSVRKITIVPSEIGAGFCEYFISESKTSHEERVRIAMAGLAAELLCFGKFRGGPCKEDLLKASSLLNEFETQEIGKIPHRLPIELIFTNALHPKKIARMNKYYSETKDILLSNFNELEELAQRLLKEKTITNY